MQARHALRRRRNLAGVSLLVITASILGALIGYQHTIPTQTDKRPIPAAPIAPPVKAKTLDSGNEPTNSHTLQLAAARGPRNCLPVARPYVKTASFGARGARWRSFHTGQDFAAPTGRLVRAATYGKVISARWAGPYGNQVKLRHSNGWVTSYNHLSRMSTRPGRYVRACWAVGRVGTTGNSSGPHLHFEVRKGNRAVNPISWLRVRGLRP